jgi:alanine racemase
MPKAQETLLEIDLNALKHNYNYITSKLKKDTKLLAVVKAFAYGSDANEVATMLEELKVDYFAVAYIQEGVALRDAGIRTPILVLHPQPVNFKLMIDRCLEPNLYSFRVLEQFIAIASEAKQTNYPVHLKFNTGLNRLGFTMNDVDSLISKLKQTSVIKTKSLFSHLAASEDMDERPFTLKQISLFKTIAEAFADKIGYMPLLHISNTSGVLNYPEAQFDMVRTGIGLYGFGNAEAVDKELKPVASLKSVISQIHQVNTGESVGYNRGFIAKSPQKSATIPIGHADGIGRFYGHGKGFVSINGKQAPIIGNVCMDMIMVNVTDIDCEEGDEVIIFGKDLDANRLAKQANTITYELLTAISQRVKRVFLK